MSGSSCNTAAGVIELKQISNVTIVGVGSGAVFDQLGIHIRESSNIIIQNVTVRNVKKSGSPTSNGGDAIGMESDVRNVWVDHVTLEASGGESEGYDGLFDMKDDTQYVTLSYSILRNSGRGGLIGSSESDRSQRLRHVPPQPVREHRLPHAAAARRHRAHLQQLLREPATSPASTPGPGRKAKVENNYFKNSKDVLGTFYTDRGRATGRSRQHLRQRDLVQPQAATTNPAGPNPTSTTTVSIPYSYTPRRRELRARRSSRQTAGANTGLKVSNGTCTPHDPAPDDARPDRRPTTPDPTTPTPTPTPPPSGTNLSLGAGADGSSKASGTSYGNVDDGHLSTYWSPSGSTGTHLGQVGLRHHGVDGRSSARRPAPSGTIGSWRVLNGDTGAVLTSGSGAGVISFTATSLKKITFEITSATGTPQVAEFETYAG